MLVGFVICLSLLYIAADATQDCLSSPRGSDYSGTRRVTAGGLFCQRWDQQYPQAHTYYTEWGRHGDYCRNDRQSAMPWCYTTSSATRWQYCDIPSCTDDLCLPDDDKTGRNYQGTKHVTISGYMCQHWSRSSTNCSMPTGTYAGLPRNYCRNPNNAPMLWCFTKNSTKIWDYCYIRSCTAPPGPCLTEADPRGRYYEGTVSETADGTPCQRWSSQSQSQYASQGNHNYCRNPDNKAAPWCYTNHNQGWAFCNIRRCY